MKNKERKQWKNQLVFPLLFSICFLYSFLLQWPFLFLIGCYFLAVLCYKKRYVLVLIGLLCSGLLFIRMKQTYLIEVPEETTIQLQMRVFPDTIQLNGDLITFEGKTVYGKIRGQYKATSKEEVKEWGRRTNWNKQLLVNGFFKEKEQKRNKHGFDVSDFYFSAGLLGNFIVEEIRSEKTLSSWYSLRKIRATAIDWMEIHFPPKLTVYLWALLLGYRDQSFHELRDIYSGSGILHFFTISGMHVYLFYGWMHYLFRRTRLTFQEFAPAGALLIFFSIFLFGQGVSVLRASCLYLLNVSLKEKRIYLSSMDRFSIIALLLLLLEPKTLLQLSGILSLGISWFILLCPFSTEGFYGAVKRSQVIACLSAPIFMYSFFELPLLTGILTAICAPFFSFFLLPLGAITSLLTMLGIKMVSLNWLLLAGISLFEELLSYTKSLVLITGKPPLLLVWLTIISSLLIYQSSKKRWLFVPLLILLISQRVSLTASVSFVDVGQGDSVVLQSLFNQEVYVIDTGGRLQFEQEKWKTRNYRASIEYTLLPFLKGEGVTQITGLFLTHGDADHMGDALELIQQIPVQWVYVGKGSLSHPSIQRLAAQLPKRTNIREVSENEQIGKRIPLKVLAPQHLGKGENEDSLVLTTVIRNTSFLMTGDLGKEGEKQLLTHYPKLKAEVMKLGHHGSQTSTDPAFIEKIGLKHGIISCGKNNRFNHPHPEVLDTLNLAKVQIYRTDQDGMVRYVWYLKDRFPKIWTAKEH